jgi:hypothetical protein
MREAIDVCEISPVSPSSRAGALRIFFEESGGQGIGDLAAIRRAVLVKDGGYHALSERVWTSVFMAADLKVLAELNIPLLLAADEHR